MNSQQHILPNMNFLTWIYNNCPSQRKFCNLLPLLFCISAGERSYRMENVLLHITSFPPLAFRIIRGLSVSYLHLRGHPVLAFLTSFPYLPRVVVLCFYRAKVALASQDSDILARWCMDGPLTQMIMAFGPSGMIMGVMVLDQNDLLSGRHSWNHYESIPLLPLRPLRQWRATSTGF